MKELVILVPVLNRPHNIEPLLASIKKVTPERYRVLFIADADDAGELEAIRMAKAECLTLTPPVNYATKINIGFGATTEPLVFMAADDLLFHPEWFKRAKSYLQEGIDVVGTRDLCNIRTERGQHSTHTLFRRSYIEECSGVVDEPGKVLHEGYVHEYCDDEFIQTAMARGRYAHAYDSIVQHLHPLNNTAPDDETYQLGRQGTHISRDLFRRRMQLWTT